MDNSKLKNIIIIILLALNIFLLAAVLLDKADTRAENAAARLAVAQALENAGISVGDGVDTDIEALPAYSVSRDMAAERILMNALIDCDRYENLGGNIMFYASGNGQVSARGTGEIDALFTAPIFSGGDHVKTAEKALSRLNLDAYDSEERESEDGEDIVTLLCMWNGKKVFNAHMTFTFGGDQLLMMSGTRIFDKSTQTQLEVMDSFSALMRFVEVVREEGYVCSRLEALETGYILSVTVSGESTLSPIWHFITDAGGIFINAVTGKIENPV